MGILNYSTGVSSEKTIAEIQKILVKHGAHKIVTDYKDGLPISVTFCLTINDNLTGFSLPANYSGVLKAMKADRKIENRFCNPEQAQRVAWRIIKDWVEAQMAIVQAQLADMAEVFLPYLITKSGSTLYNEVKSGSIKLLN